MLNKLDFLCVNCGICNIYAANCQLIDVQNGFSGSVEFACDQDISLDDNKVIFIFSERMLKLTLSMYCLSMLILVLIKSLKMSDK